MFKSEKRFMNLLAVGILTLIGLRFILSDPALPFLLLISVPLYFITIFFIETVMESRDRVDSAVLFCLDENEFNVIDKVEQLRLYFKDTRDVINYLSIVDSRLLAYVFDERNISLSYKEYILGAIKCLSYFTGYKGSHILNIDSTHLMPQERITAILSTLYLAAMQINQGVDTIYIYSKKSKGAISIDVIDENNNRIDGDIFSSKLFTLFSTENLVLSRANL